MPPRRELAIYVLVAMVGVWPTLRQPAAMVGDGVDAYGTWWFYGWIRDCILHGADPSFTTRFFHPLGKDIFAHTGNNFVDAVVAVPFRVLGARWFAFFAAFVLVGNACTFRPLAKLVLQHEGRAFAATLLWLVNPCAIFEMTAGRPTQAFLWYYPAVPYFLLRAAREPGWRNGVLLGLSSALVGWTYWFACFFVALLCVPVAVAAWRESSDRRGTLRRWALGAGVALLVVAPAAIPMLRLWGTGQTPGGVPKDQSVFAAPGAIGNSIGQDLHGLALMETMGAPLFTTWSWALPLAAALAWRVGRRGLGWAWFLALGLCVYAGIGPRLGTDPGSPISVPYMVAWKYAPFFNRLWFPYRFAGAGFVAAALLVAAALPGRWAAVGGLVLGATGLYEQHRSRIFPFAWHDVRTPTLIAELADRGSGILYLPFQVQHDALIWNVDAPTFLFGGMGESAPVFWPQGFKRRLSHPLVRALRGALGRREPAQPQPPGAAAAWVGDGTENPRWLVLRADLQAGEAERDPSFAAPAEAVDRLTRVVGARPVGLQDALVVWDLTGRVTELPGFEVDEEVIRAAEFAAPSAPAWEAGLKEQGRLGRPGGRE